ncbi:hypothetical protein Acr_22g0007030 [Actinidia rufa]|uniref:Retrotransposon gag domain-containing protein n=1 Tax=Actinidia rufa TaxID=165716 RepID=A0A7J0GKJ7_9ERIC|nr:hypothetical protein Acr_22g0007030 [Actinidia rufa]
MTHLSLSQSPKPKALATGHHHWHRIHSPPPWTTPPSLTPLPLPSPPPPAPNPPPPWTTPPLSHYSSSSKSPVLEFPSTLSRLRITPRFSYTTLHSPTIKKGAPPLFKASLRMDNVYSLACVGRRRVVVEVQYRGRGHEQFLLLVTRPSDFYHNNLSPSMGMTVLKFPYTCIAVLLPRPSASSPLDNRAHFMANTSQAPDLVDLHCEMHNIAKQIRVMNENNACLIQHLTKNNSPPPTTHVPKVERSLHSNDRAKMSLRVTRVLTEHEIGDVNHPVHALGEKKSPVSSESLGHLAGLLNSESMKGKTDPMNHMDSYKNLMLLQEYSDEVMCKALYRQFHELPSQAKESLPTSSPFHQKEIESLKEYVKRFNQAVLEVEDPSDKVVITTIMEGLHPGPLFDSFFKNVPETLSTLQSKAEKYIVAEELVKAKRRRRGRDDHKRKELDTRRF